MKEEEKGGKGGGQGNVSQVGTMIGFSTFDLKRLVSTLELCKNKKTGRLVKFR